MKRALILAVALLGLTRAPAHALFVDTFINSAKYAKDQAYQAFVKIKMIEQLRVMKQNYDASMRYYAEFKRLNSGRGLLYNVGEQLKASALQMGEELKYQIDRDFVNTYRTDTKVDQFFQNIDRGIASNMRYAGDELANVISNRKVGIDLAKNAQGISPKDAASLGVKAQGLQLQLLVQLHEDNLRLIQLQAMRLANETRQREGERKLMESIRKGVERRAPGLTAREEQ